MDPSTMQTATQIQESSAAVPSCCHETSEAGKSRSRLQAAVFPCFGRGEVISHFHAPIVSVSKSSRDGISSTVPSESRALWKLLKFVDIIVVYCVVGPLVPIYWSSTWFIFDEYLIPGNVEISSWVSLLSGSAILIVASSIQDPLQSFSNNQSKPARHVFMRIYIYIMAVACVNQWRGLWLLMDHYTGVSILNALVTVCVAAVTLLILRCYGNVLAPPVAISLDIIKNDEFMISSFYAINSGALLLFLDSAFTVIVPGLLVITVWRGLWELADLTLSPDDLHFSAIWSLICTYSLALVLMILQVPAQRIATYLEKIHWLAKLAFEDVAVVLSSVVSVLHWKGFWNLLDLYIPYRPYSLLVCHALSIGLLMLGLTASSVLVRGCVRDGSLPIEECMTVTPHYITELVTIWNSRKLSTVPNNVTEMSFRQTSTTSDLDTDESHDNNQQCHL